MDTNFKKILFKTAFCCMACDGHIDQKEIEELKLMNSKTSYFGDIDLSSDLNKLLEELQRKGVQVVNDLFQELRQTELNPVQELLILEVALRIIYADKIIDDNEVQFLKLLRGRLAIYDEIIMERFGNDNLLFNKQYSQGVEAPNIDKYLNKLKMPEHKDMDSIKNNFDL